MATAKKTANLKKDDAAKASTSVAVRKPTGGAVVDVKAMQDALRAQAAQMNERTTPPGGNKIALGNDKMFKLPDGSKVPELRAVIVDFVTVHNFYERPFDPKNITPPGCFAVGTNPKDMAPVDEAPNRQAETCQVCPMNEFGSSGDGKACKNGRRLALLPVDDEGNVLADDDILMLDISPTGIKGFDGYVQSVARTFQLPPLGVVTTFSADPNSEWAKVVCSDPQPLNNVADAFARQAEAKDMLMAKPDFSGWVPVNQTPGNRRGGAVKTATGRR